MHIEDSSDLFNLIQRMSKGEKRHFKMYMHARSPHKPKNNYLILFDALEKQKQYNEEKITKLGLVKKTHLRILKHYLYNHILNSLRILRSKGDNLDSRIQGMLENARIFRDKELEEEELKFLNKAKSLALQHERWGPALETILILRRVIIGRNDLQALEILEQELKTVLLKLNNLSDYMQLHRRMAAMVKQSVIKRGGYNKEMDKLEKHPLLQDEKQALTAGAQRLAYNTRFLYHQFMGNHSTYYKILVKNLQLVESNYAAFEFPELTYSQVLNNLFIAQAELGKYEDALASIEKINAVLKNSKIRNSEVFFFSSINETNYYMVTCEFKKGIDASKRIEKELRKYDPNHPHSPALYFNIATLYFGARQYEKALGWVNSIINAPASLFHTDIQAWSRIFRIIIHYELQTRDLLDHLVVSTYRFILKRKQLYKTEESILRFIRRLEKTSATKRSLMTEFRRFRDELILITRDPGEKNALIYFDLISWIESKIENKSFEEILKKKRG